MSPSFSLVIVRCLRVRSTRLGVSRQVPLGGPPQRMNQLLTVFYSSQVDDWGQLRGVMLVGLRLLRGPREVYDSRINR